MTRILFAFVAVGLLTWGAFSCKVGHFGPILGGIMSITLGVVILLLIVLSYVEQTVNIANDPFADLDEEDIDDRDPY